VDLLVLACTFVDHNTHGSPQSDIRLYLALPQRCSTPKNRPVRRKVKITPMAAGPGTSTHTGCPENIKRRPPFTSIATGLKLKTRYASLLSLANSTAVTLRAALLGLASDAPGCRVMTGTSVPTRREKDVNIQVSLTHAASHKVAMYWMNRTCQRNAMMMIRNKTERRHQTNKPRIVGVIVTSQGHRCPRARLETQ
jgi:hypothetical protein